MNAKSDILIIGGGIIGLTIAVELRQLGCSVTVLSRDFSQAASHAAAGMLAPYAEQISPGPMLDLCLRSRWLYADWVTKLENLTGQEVGYYPCGILSPVYEMPVQTQPLADSSQWLNHDEIHRYQPGLGHEVVGGWWHPDDGQVDNRKLVSALRQAAQLLGVNILEGVEVTALPQQGGRITHAQTKRGNFQADTYVLASGSWAKELVPLPIFPVKGQMLALRMPQKQGQSLPLQRVLFGPNTYLVPRQDGRLIVGATSERVDWQAENTPQGIQALLTRAIRLYPPLAHWAIADFWWGFRPGTVDEEPILGPSTCDNLIFALGHYRNGILLAPITAKLIGKLIVNNVSDPLLASFRGDRHFTQPDQT